MLCRVQATAEISLKRDAVVHRRISTEVIASDSHMSQISPSLAQTGSIRVAHDDRSHVSLALTPSQSSLQRPSMGKCTRRVNVTVCMHVYIRIFMLCEMRQSFTVPTTTPGYGVSCFG